MRPLRRVNWSVPVLVGILIVGLGVGWLSEAGAQVVFSDPGLPPESDPPDCGNLMSLYEGSGVHVIYPGPIEMSDPHYKCFQNVDRQAVGSDENETFDCIWECEMDFGFGLTLVTLTGPASHMVYGKVGNTTGMFDSEIISMSLSGTAGVANIVLRESPTLSSSGVTVITDLGGGLYQIDSFFDVFTELSFDGGPWMAQTSQAGRITLVPAESVPTQPTLWGGLKALFH